jgi:hypothetical protein
MGFVQTVDVHTMLSFSASKTIDFHTKTFGAMACLCSLRSAKTLGLSSLRRRVE